jgi:8-amino-7-oxononanoate synthase
MSSLENFLTQKIARRTEEGLTRKLTTHQNLVDFSSNDYLGLARSEELFDRINMKMESLPGKFNGATGSRLLSGNTPYAEALEKKLAAFFKSGSALLFNSGYAANQAVLSAIPQKDDTILYDELAHACIKDGARLSLATRHPFRHNDLDDLEKKIKRVKAGKVFIAVESIYSMDGDECPLRELTTIAGKYDAAVILDEAHSTGVEGIDGNGSAIAQELEHRIDIRIHTFGKALGVHGACVAGSAALSQYLINFARPFIYTTALPPHSLAAIDCALDHLKDNHGLQQVLKSKIELFLKHANFSNRTISKSSIQTAIFPGNDAVKRAALSLQQQGFDVRPILSPTVPRNAERLRICLHSFNRDEDILRLAEALKRC